MNRISNRFANSSIYYGWFIVITGTFCIFSSLGLGRFALGMLLPSMSKSLNLDYSQMGIVSTFNFVGYMVAVLVSGFISSRIGARNIIFFSLLLVGISMYLISKSNSFYTLLIFFTLTGIGSGASNVPMMSLIPTWFEKKKRGKAAGFVVIGSGFAILLSGKMIPYLNSLRLTDGWRLSWVVLAVITIVISFLCLLVIRNSPADLGLTASANRLDKSQDNTIEEIKRSQKIPKKIIMHMGAIYFIFGYTYVIYVTFIVTTLVNERGFSEFVAGNFWSIVGFLSLFSGPVFGIISDRFGRKIALTLVFAIQMTSYFLIALNLPGIFLYLSIGLFGIAAWSIPTIMAALVGDYVGPKKAAEAFGLITFIFAWGQIAGPGIAGIIAESTKSFSGSFYMAGIFAAFAIILSMTLKKPEHV